jgi:probable phosphomutase (TIGR03848 family)
MALVLLVRHGENDYVQKGRLAGRLPGVHLNETGHKQAKAVAELLKGAPIKAVYSSPLERTMETAKPIARFHGLKVKPRKGLIEVDFGDWENRKIKKLSQLKLWNTVQHLPSQMKFPGGETFFNSQYRVVKEIMGLSEKHDLRDVIICVSHSDVIKLAISYFIGLPLDQFQHLQISPGSISALFLGKGYCRLLSMNYGPFFTLPRS